MGAILNATFGSMVEVILFIIMLKKGKDSDQECYQELVKSSLTGVYISIIDSHSGTVVSTLECGCEGLGFESHQRQVGFVCLFVFP